MLHSAETNTAGRRFCRRLKNARGFTLIELMATLVILALIIAIAVPAIGNITSKAAEQARLASIELIENAGEIAHIDELPFDTEKPASVTETDIYLIPTLVEEGYLKLDEDSEFYDDEQWVRKMNKSGMFKYMGRGDGTTPDPGDGGGETPEEPEVPVEPEVPAEPEFVTYCPAEGETSIYTWKSYAGDVAYITGFASDYVLPSTDVVLPTMICEDTVTGISSLAFAEKGLTSVVLPEKLKLIQSGAFRKNQLDEVVLPDTVTSIGSTAFSQNGLSRVDLSDALVTIGVSAFENNDLTTVDFPTTLKTIEGKAFKENKLTSVQLPEGFSTLGSSSFETNDIVTVGIPSTLENIGQAAFQDNDIVNLTIPDTVKTMGMNAFNMNKISTLQLSNGLAVIPNHAFSQNNLTSVSIPASVTHINQYAFNTNDLTSVTIPETVTTIGASAFGYNNLDTITVWNPAVVYSDVRNVFDRKDFVDSNVTVRAHAGSTTATMAAGQKYTFSAIN